MNLDNFLHKLKIAPETIEFAQTMALIDEIYEFTPTAFKNGDVFNDAGQNSGSCKIFSFGRLHNLTETQTLSCFGEHHRGVVETPDGSDHGNIRNFMKTGWNGIELTSNALVAK